MLFFISQTTKIHLLLITKTSFLAVPQVKNVCKIKFKKMCHEYLPESGSRLGTIWLVLSWS